MRIIFMGTAEFAVAGLIKTAQSGHDIVSVITAPDLPRGRGQKVSFTPVKSAAIELGLPVIQPENLKDPAFAERIRKSDPDLIVVIAFRILPKEIFTIPKLGSINLHASLLPKYRGAAPIHRAIMNGEKKTGVTTFFLKEKVDTGNIILQKKTEIGDDETAGELHDRLAVLGAEAVIETIAMIENNRARPWIQDESLASPAPKLNKENTRINWNRPAQEIKNFIRGLSPYPCAWTTYQGESIKIYRADISECVTEAADPGTILSINPHTDIRVAAGDNKIIHIKELQPQSKKRMTASEYLRGYRVEILSRFE